MGTSLQPDDVIVEFQRIGTSVKVTAVDPVTHREVSIVGPARATREHLVRTVLDKLRYVLSREGTSS